jgi:hypothetical protein
MKTLKPETVGTLFKLSNITIAPLRFQSGGAYAKPPVKKNRLGV